MMCCLRWSLLFSPLQPGTIPPFFLNFHDLDTLEDVVQLFCRISCPFTGTPHLDSDIPHHSSCCVDSLLPHPGSDSHSGPPLLEDVLLTWLGLHHPLPGYHSLWTSSSVLSHSSHTGSPVPELRTQQVLQHTSWL